MERGARRGVGSVLDGVESCGVHAEEPVADGTAESGFVETLVFSLWFERGETFADAFFGEGGYPQTVYGTFGTGELHDPSLYEFAFLSGIAAVDDAFGAAHELLDDVELLLYALVVFEAYAEAGGDHGELSEAPPLPVGGVVLGVFEFAEVPEGPGHLVTVAFEVTLVLLCGTEYVGYVASHAGLFCYANDHGRGMGCA